MTKVQKNYKNANLLQKCKKITKMQNGWLRLSVF